MIEFLSTWAKSLGVTVVLVSIFEMILPNNKTKKYIRMVLGVFVIFTMIAPFIQNKDKFNLNEINLENYVSVETSNVDQTSMNERIKDLYEEELEKDITNKLEEQGFEVESCKVEATIAENEDDETKINQIKLTVKKNETIENKTDEESNTENKIVTEIQKIKEVDTSININKEEKEDTETNDSKEVKSKNLSKVEIQNIKKFLIDEYGVSEKCLKIN